MRLSSCLILVIVLLLVTASVASANIFNLEVEANSADFEAQGGGYDLSEDTNLYLLNYEVNWLLIRTGVELGYADMDSYALTTLGLRVGYELGLGKFRGKVFGGYQGLIFQDDSGSTSYSHNFSGLVIGAGFDWKLNYLVSFKAMALVPVTGSYYLSGNKVADSDVNLEYYKAGFYFTPVPLVDVFLNYRVIGAEHQNNVKFNSSGLSLGMNFGF